MSFASAAWSGASVDRSHDERASSDSSRKRVDLDGPRRAGTLCWSEVTRRSAMSDAGTRDEIDIVTKLSPRSVSDTVTRLVGMAGAKGMKLFAVIDQSAEAGQVGLQLRETTLV